MLTMFVEGGIFQVWLADCLSAAKIIGTRNMHQASTSLKQIKESAFGWYVRRS